MDTDRMETTRKATVLMETTRTVSDRMETIRKVTDRMENDLNRTPARTLATSGYLTGEPVRAVECRIGLMPALGTTAGEMSDIVFCVWSTMAES